MSTTKPVLREGNKVPAVRELQMLLKAHLPNQRKLTTDSDFGSNTKQAVKVFQHKVNLDADGVVGANTWRALLAHNQLEALV